MVGTEREVGPEVLVLAQHLGDALRALEAGMRPQDAGLRPLLEQALDCIDVGMRMQEQIVFPGQLHHPARNRQIGVGAIEVELADTDVFITR
jgi:hypothetical protein